MFKNHSLHIYTIILVLFGITYSMRTTTATEDSTLKLLMH